MMLHSIELKATESNWRLFMTRKADKAFLPFQEKLFKRDDHTCQFCGFRAKAFLEIVNLDSNYLNNKVSNLATACPMCAQCFFLEAIGKSDFGGGTLIYMPETSQGELNALCHVLFAQMIINSAQASQAKNIYRTLKLRAQIVDKELGDGMSNPALYGHVIIDALMSKEHKCQLHNAIVPKLRVLPDLTRFSTQVEAWMQAGLQELTFE